MRGVSETAARKCDGGRRNSRPPRIIIPLPPPPLVPGSQLDETITTTTQIRSETTTGLKAVKFQQPLEQHDDYPKSKRRKLEANELLNSLRSMDPNEQLDLWKEMLNNHPFDLQQLRSLHTAINNRIKLDIVSAVPYEIALYIMSFLSPEDLCRAAQVSRSWRTVCDDNRMWREKCKEEGLLNDELTMDIIFRRRINRSHHVQEEFVKNFNSAVPRSEFKSAYLNHINIVRNWRTRNLDQDILEPLAQGQPQQARQQRPQVAQQNVESSQDTPKQLLKRHGMRNQGSQSNLDKSDGTNGAPMSPSSQDNSNNDNLTNNSINNTNDYNNLTKRHKMRLRCHEDFVITCLQYNPKSELIVSGSDDQTLKVWSSETGQCIATLEGHTGGVWSSQLTDNDIVISGATDRTVRIWKARTGQLLNTLYGHTSTVRCLAFDNGLVVSGSRDATLRLWDIESGNCEHVFLGHNAAVRCVEFRDGIIVSGSYDWLVMVWDATTGNCIHTLAGHHEKIYSLHFDGKTIASGSLDKNICIWDAETGEMRHLLRGHDSLTSQMQRNGNLLVSANADSFCKIWNIDTGQCVRTLGENDPDNNHTSAITSVHFNDRHVVTSSDDGTVKLWDTETGEFVRNLVTLPTARNGGVVWRIRASYTKLICAVGSRVQIDDTQLLVLDFDD